MIMFGKVISSLAMEMTTTPGIVSTALSSLARWKSVRASSGSTSTAQHSQLPFWEKPVAGSLKCNLDATIF